MSSLVPLTPHIPVLSGRNEFHHVQMHIRVHDTDQVWRKEGALGSELSLTDSRSEHPVPSVRHYFEGFE